MEYLKIYISIEDPLTKQDLNISGRFDLLCDFLAGMNKSIATNELPAPMQSSPARIDPSPLGETVQTATKRKPARKAETILTT